MALMPLHRRARTGDDPAAPIPLDTPVTTLQRWLTAPVILYFFVILMVPVSANGTKLVLALLASIGSLLLLMVRREWPIHREVFNVALLTICTGAAWLMYGLYAETPGAVFSFMIYLIWPIFYLFTFTSALQSYGTYRVIRRTMVLALILIGLFVLYYVGYSFGYLPATPLLNLPFGQGINISTGYTELRLYAISSMIFLLPYCVSKLAYRPPGARALSYAAAIVLGIAATILAGRRAAILTMAAAPIVLIALIQFTPALERFRIRRNLWLTALAAAFLVGVPLLALPVNLDASGFLSYVASAFDPSSSGDAQVRFEQLAALLNGWDLNLKTLFFGSGLGATAGYVRSERVWEYELQYPLHLFQTGILGTMLYASSIGWIYWRGIGIIRRGGEVASEMVALLVGMTCFLLANATNPYLQAYGHLWTLFLPVAYINLVKLRQPA